MAKALSDSEKVTEHIQKLDVSIAETVDVIRQIILTTDKEIAEQIKWNSPSFYYSGEMKPFDPKEYKRDIIVMNLHKNNIMLVLPTGAKSGIPVVYWKAITLMEEDLSNSKT